MLRAVIPVFYSFLLLILSIVFQEGEVVVKVNAPAQVDAGSVFYVNLVLTKSQLEGFSRFAQDIPAGLLASSQNSANADFTFQDNRIRLIWLKLPGQDTVHVSYAIKVDERLKGNFTLGGRFSYIEDNQRKSVEVVPQQITIIPSPNIDPRLVVDIKNFREKVIPDLTTAMNARVACIRQKPDLTYSQGGIVISILVNKEKLEKFAKIEESVPPGYSAIAVEKKDAIFTFRDQTVKFLWMTLPADPWFLISYKLIPLSGNPTQDLTLKGVFSYIEGKKTSSVDIIEEDVSFDALTQVRVDNLMASIGRLPAADTSQGGGHGTLADAGNTGGPNNNTSKEKNGSLVKKTTNETQGKGSASGTVRTGKYTKEQVDAEIFRNEKSVIAYALEPENGIYYRVQVAAGHQPVNMNKYFRKLNFREKIRTERHQGWYKYSIGSWDTYIQARDYRVQLWNNSSIKDAFVAAYNNGKRITVQEALMVSNQKWYQ